MPFKSTHPEGSRKQQLTKFVNQLAGEDTARRIRILEDLLQEMTLKISRKYIDQAIENTRVKYACIFCGSTEPPITDDTEGGYPYCPNCKGV